MKTLHCLNPYFGLSPMWSAKPLRLRFSLSLSLSLNAINSTEPPQRPLLHSFPLHSIVIHHVGFQTSNNLLLEWTDTRKVTPVLHDPSASLANARPPSSPPLSVRVTRFLDDAYNFFGLYAVSFLSVRRSTFSNTSTIPLPFMSRFPSVLCLSNR